MSRKNSEVVGVVKGRFQTYALHEGHRYTLECALERHETVLVIVGTRYDSTVHDPLPFALRKMMLESAYPGRLTVIEEPASASSYEKRSQELTELIKAASGGRDAVIYGARDSIVHTYQGPFPVILVPTVYSGSATAMRAGIEYENSVSFRKGYMRAVNDRGPTAHPAVDLAIISRNLQQVTLIELEEEEGKLRFPGVFYDPTIDDSYDAAAVRCVTKEVPGALIDPPWPVKSIRIDDWRYRQTNDGVVTLLYRANSGYGKPRPGKGIKAVHQVNFMRVPEVICDTHRPLSDMMASRWNH